MDDLNYKLEETLQECQSLSWVANGDATAKSFVCYLCCRYLPLLQLARYHPETLYHPCRPNIKRLNTILILLTTFTQIQHKQVSYTKLLYIVVKYN